MKFNIIICGVGGQGILTLAKIIAETALQSDLDVKTFETHGMSQRCGSVISHVRIGEGIYSSIIPKGKADMMISTEPFEGLRNLDYLKEGSNSYVSKNQIIFNGSPGLQKTLTQLKSNGVILIDTFKISQTTGSSFSQNTGLLGAASENLPLSLVLLKNSINKIIKKDVHQNLLAFDLGVNTNKKR